MHLMMLTSARMRTSSLASPAAKMTNTSAKDVQRFHRPMRAWMRIVHVLAAGTSILSITVSETYALTISNVLGPKLIIRILLYFAGKNTYKAP